MYFYNCIHDVSVKKCANSKVSKEVHISNSFTNSKGKNDVKNPGSNVESPKDD